MAHAGGRPTKYKPEYCEGIIEFFSRDVVRERTETVEGKNWSKDTIVREAIFFPSVEGFAVSIGVDDTTLITWTKKWPKFLAAYLRAKDIQKALIYEYGITGQLDSRLAGLFAQANMGWATRAEDKSDQTITIKHVDQTAG
jgi:hypothetical protein